MRVAKFAAAFLILTMPVTAWALDGNNALQLSTLAGWNAFEVVTQGDDISTISDSGYGSTADRGTYDGLGAYRTGDTLSIFVNNETTPAAISRVDLDFDDFRQAIQSTVDSGTTAFPSSFVTGMGYAYDSIFDGTYHAVNNPSPVANGTAGVEAYSDANFARFCSGTSYVPQSFGANRGFIDPVYITGEEVDGGHFYALDEVTRTLWNIPDFGLGRWENAALVDTGNTSHVALVLDSDSGTAPGDYIRLYVGKKGIDVNGDGQVDFLERNGLRGGTIYYFDPDGAASTTDLPDGQVTGKWSTSTSGALRDTKLEDIHTNPQNGTELVFNAQTDGVYRMDLDMQFAASNFDPVASTVVIYQIDDDDAGDVGAPDNVVWSANGKIYVQEDGDGDDMFQMNNDGSGLPIKIAHALSEPSGIYDVSEVVGYMPGSVFLTSIQGSGGTSGAQLSVLISPDAQLGSYSIAGDANLDGMVNETDVQFFIDGWLHQQSVPNLASWMKGDFDQDGKTSLKDAFILHTALVEAGQGALNFSRINQPVPEPASFGLLLFALLFAASFRRRK